MIRLPLKGIKNGTADIDFTAMDRFMDMAKAAGFTKELNGYGVRTGINIRNYELSDAEAKKFGLNTYAELVKVYMAME